MKIAFDIGSHDGKNSIKLLDKGYYVYAFEPLRSSLKYFIPIEKQYENFTYLPLGVNLKSGLYTFYKNTAVGRASSLYSFNDDSALKHWPEGNIHTSIETEKIYCINLRNFCEEENISRIDYFHCDAQGNDFNILKSLGDKVDIIEEGIVETSGKYNLYNSDNNIDDIILYLKKFGFKNFYKETHSDYDTEYNLYFSKLN